MAGFKKNVSIFSDEQKQIGQVLLDLGQEHIFEHWPDPGKDDANKKRLLDQVLIVDKQYSGGLKAYVSRAKKLLQDSKDQVNPYDDYVPSVPSGLTLETQTKDGKDAFDRLEASGMSQMHDAAFVLVAGGLGERLGYNGIKVALPSEITTETQYLDLYIQHILALQQRARVTSKNDSLILPLAIMTSGDTHDKTVALLKEHKYFGADQDKEQITFIKQELVPSMSNNDARFVLNPDDLWQLDTKPHGHGDVHMLLYSSGTAGKWAKEGRKWIVFFQDTNGLVFRAIPAAIGASIESKLVVNSLTVPRRPGEAVGAICKLTSKKTKEAITINVEYNQLDALMTGSGVKDETDKNGFSKYPGNINVLVFEASSYAVELKKSQGVIGEFVNPKYKNKEKTEFTKPTRLECMMQDYPKQLGSEAAVGYVQFERWTSFSAVKNNISDAVAKQKSSGAAESGSSGESDIYYYGRKLLHSAGAEVDVDGKDVTYSGVTVKSGASVVLLPNFGTTQAEIASRVKGKLKISSSSTLIVDGDVTFGDVEIDGALVVRAAPGAKVFVDKLKVKNKGYEFEPLTEKDSKTVDQRYQIRGYVLKKHEQQEAIYSKPGSYELSSSTSDTSEPASKKVKEGSP